MSRGGAWIAAAFLATLVMGGCASVPRDAGIGEVQTKVEELSGQRLAWSPEQPVEAPDDEKLRPRLLPSCRRGEERLTW